MNVMIDTNIIVDAFTHREPFFTDAEQVILLAANKKITAQITASTITDIYFIVNRHFKNKVEAKSIILKLSKLVDFVAVDKSDCLKALDVDMSDYEDALLSVCAKKSKSKYIVTRNTQDFANSDVSAISPSELIKLQ